MWSLRAATPADSPALRALLGEVWSNDGDAVAYHGAGTSPGFVAETSGQIVGYAQTRRPSLHRNHTYCGVHVLPAHRRQGIGAALWEAAVAPLSGPLKTATSAGQTEAVAFLRRRGLGITVQTHLPTLETADLDAGQVESWVRAARDAGYDLLPLSALSGPEVRRQLTRLHLDVYAQTHRHDPPTWGSEGAAESDFLGEDLRPEWLWVARRGETLAGVSSVRDMGEWPNAELGWFGVTRPFAGDDALVTRALTALALQACARDGVQHVKAELDSVDPNATDLRHTLPWRAGEVWLTLTRGARS